MSDADLLFMSAARAAAQIRAGKLSPVDYVDAVLAGIARANPALNAFSHVMADEARRDAITAERAVRRGDPLGPLHGVPVHIKDLVEVAGVPFRRGTAIFADAVGAKDDITVTRLRAAGAIVVGKTATPEFGVKALTDGPGFGITRNPWNPERTPGGSSGGAAAATAAFMGPLHQGSDAAGSIRIPAAFSGVFGHKPTFGLVPNYPLPPHIGNLANMGPITRTVTDAALMLNVLAQPDSRDFMSAPAVAQDENYLNGLEAGIEGVRIAYSPTLGGNGWADDDVASAVKAAADVLADLGAIVEEADPEIPDTRPIIDAIWSTADTWLISQISPEKRELMDPGLLAIAEEGRKYGVTELVDSYAKRVLLGNAMARFHQTYDLLLTPQMPLEAFTAGRNVPEGRDMKEWVDWSPFTYPFNLTMQPACSVPCGLGNTRMPVAFQLIGRHWEDALLLRTARAYEKARPFVAAPGYV